MPKPESNAVTLLAVLITGALVGRLWDSWMAVLAGLVLLVILFAYDSAPDRTFWQSVGFAGVCGFCVMLICISLITITGTVGRPPSPGWTFYAPASSYILPLVWLGGTILFLIIDRVRKTGAPEPVYRRAPIEPSPIPPDAVPETTSTTAPPPNAIALPIGAGKPATIYLNLVGEGLACLRPVQAEHMGKDYYRIVETVPEGEAWEYQPGQIVRCQKRNLSSGKALVAIDEAPRAR